SLIRRVLPKSELRKGAQMVVGYVGIISDQDGVDHFIRMLHYLVQVKHCRDIRAVIIGDGPAFPDVRQLAHELGLADLITFTGYLYGEDLLAALSTFDIGIIPDPKNEYNDKIAMNKVFEYSTLGIPIIAYDLSETRRLLGDAAVFANGTIPEALADA